MKSQAIRTLGIKSCRIGAGYLTLTLTLVAAASAQGTGARPLTLEQQMQWAQDSAKFVTDSAKWVRDSLVRDSISRTVNTDSMFHDYHRMLDASDPIAILSRIECEPRELAWRYGAIPGLDAVHRMHDTVFKHDDAEKVKRMWAKVENMSQAQQASLGRCDMSTWGPMMPELFEGTDVNALPGKPARPQRP